MGGFLGIGGSSAKTDRATQLSAQQGSWNIFNKGLGLGDASQATGTADLSSAKSTLGGAEQYWRNLLTAGRTGTAQNSAPAVDAVIAQGDTARRSEAASGTGRTGGTAALNREASTATGAKIDDIVNQNLVGGRAAGAQGLERVAGVKAEIGGAELRNALSMFGLSEDAVRSIMSNATDSREISNKMNLQTQEQWGQAIGSLLMAGGL